MARRMSASSSGSLIACMAASSVSTGSQAPGRWMRSMVSRSSQESDSCWNPTRRGTWPPAITADTTASSRFIGSGFMVEASAES